MNNKQILSNNLKHLMEKRHISRITISEMLDVPYTTVTSWIKGDNYPRIKRLEQLAILFRVSKAQLIETPLVSRDDVVEPDIGTELHDMRKRQHIGIDPLSAKTGVSGSNISRIENNRIKPTIATLVKLAKGLGVSKGRIYQIAGIMPKTIDLSTIFRCKNVSWHGHPLDRDDYEMFKLWFNNKYRK